MKQNDFSAFFTELFKRFALKSPRFFQVLQFIGMICTIITGIPELLQQYGIVLPEPIASFASTTVAIAGLMLWAVSKLPVDNPHELPATTRKKKLPFTVKKS